MNRSQTFKIHFSLFVVQRENSGYERPASARRRNRVAVPIDMMLELTGVRYYAFYLQYVVRNIQIIQINTTLVFHSPISHARFRLGGHITNIT